VAEEASRPASTAPQDDQEPANNEEQQQEEAEEEDSQESIDAILKRKLQRKLDK